MGAYRIDTENLINGDYKQMHQVIIAAGLKPKKQIFKNLINKEYWHYGESK